MFIVVSNLWTDCITALFSPEFNAAGPAGWSRPQNLYSRLGMIVSVSDNVRAAILKLRQPVIEMLKRNRTDIKVQPFLHCSIGAMLFSSCRDFLFHLLVLISVRATTQAIFRSRFS